MDSLVGIGVWITENESLLSGLAALVAVSGVILAPIGLWLQRRVPTRRIDEPTGPVEPPPGPAREIRFEDLTEPSPYEIRFARSGPLRIAYNERGSGPPHVLLTPGIISHLHVADHLPGFRDTLARLARFSHLVTFDKRGQGLSDPTPLPPDLDERCADIEAVMDAARLDRVVLIGVSEGGPMTIQFAVTRPDRVQGLVLLGTTARFIQSEEFPQGVSAQALARITSAWGTGVLRDVFFPGLSRAVMTDDTYRCFERLIATRDSIRQLVDQMGSLDVRPLLPKITVPTLVVHFTGDLAIPVRLGRLLAEGIPGAEFLEVQGVNHADLSGSELAASRIEQFCRRVGR
jgi:pimeloyl-ACP methyl ester carboxylesterase